MSRSLSMISMSRSALFSKLRVECGKVNQYSVHSMTGLSSYKSNKTVDQTKLWTNKEHDEWVDRMFGPLKKPSMAKKGDKTKSGDKNSTQS